MINSVKETHLRNMLDNGKSSEFVREEEALRFIKQGKLFDLIYFKFVHISWYDIIKDQYEFFQITLDIINQVTKSNRFILFILFYLFIYLTTA